MLLLQFQGRLRGAGGQDLGLGIEVKEQYRQGIGDQGVVVDNQDFHVACFGERARPLPIRAL
jgi:hypothetical protein